jgi:RIO-like serine/threonine protein kinase
MYKLAHKSQLSRKLISDGYSTLTNLSSQGLPIVQVDYAFKDKDGIFGFRMERLFRIRPKDISHHYEAIEDAVHQLHEKGYVHADLTFSNIMLNDQGEVRLIDFGHAGKLGEPLPPYHPYRKLKGCQIFEQEIDLLSLKAIRNTGKF